MTRTGAGLLRRGGELRFAHGVNGRARLAAMLASCDALEGDVCWGDPVGPAVGPDGGQPIMAHPPIRASDLSFAEWFEAGLAAGRVMKIDLKDLESERAIVASLAARPELARDRFVINGDLVLGPGGRPPLFSVDHGRGWRDLLGDVVVSIGSTTERHVPVYADADVDRLLAAADAIGEPLTICLEVGKLERDPTPLERIDAAGRHLSIWNADPQTAAIFARYRARLPEAFIDLFDVHRQPVG